MTEPMLVTEARRYARAVRRLKRLLKETIAKADAYEERYGRAAAMMGPIAKRELAQRLLRELEGL